VRFIDDAFHEGEDGGSGENGGDGGKEAQGWSVPQRRPVWLSLSYSKWSHVGVSAQASSTSKNEPLTKG